MKTVEKSRATSVDVARLAGVSQSAVSLLFGGKADGRVSKQARRAIHKAARELGYQPNTAARTLRSGESHLLILAVPDIDNPYFSGALKGAEKEARTHGYSVVLAAVQEERDWRPMLLDPLSSRSVDGLILFAMQPPTVTQQRALRGKAVLVDATSARIPAILLNMEDGIRRALDHLRDQGHTNIAHLASTVALETFAVRKKTYLSILQTHGLPIRADYQAAVPFSIEEAFAAAKRMLSSPDRPTAIFCDSDVLAVGVYKAAKALGLAIPQDVCVLGIDDSMIARILEPELTTVAVPAGLIGAEAVKLLLAVIKGAEVPPKSTVPLDLVIRESTVVQSNL